MAGFSEAMVLGESLGISVQSLLDVVIGSLVVPSCLTAKKDKLEKSDFEPEFPLRWMHKDLKMVEIAGNEAKISLPLANVTKATYQQAIQRQLGDKDFTALYDLWRSQFIEWVNFDTI